ncbi:sperm-associated antigen 17 [Fundulus diaphanus]
MPPGGAKKGSAKKGNSAAVQPINKNWEAGLAKAQFAEDSWQACVSSVVGGSLEEEEEVVQPLVLALQQPQRKLFSLVTWDSTLAKIHELGNPKTEKSDDLPMFHEVTQPAKVLLDAGEEIPCDLLAKILKFQLLLVKTRDQQRREAERLESEEPKQKVLPQSGSKAKLSDKKGKAPPPALEPPKEKKTKLKRRDDVDPPTYIDDEPDSGPQHYILLVGFHQPHLIGALDAINVHVANVIKLCSERKESSSKKQEESSKEEAEQEVPTNARKLDLFWSQLRSVLESGPPGSKLYDVIQLNYTVPDLTLACQTQDPNAVLQLGSQIFDGVAKLIYDSLDWPRQYQHYRDNVRLISIPTPVALDSQPAEVVPTVPPTPRSKRKSVKDQSPSPETKLPPLSVNVDMCYYNSLLDLVPPEACSVPLVLDCLLEQVVISTEQPLRGVPPVPEEQKADGGPWLDCDLVSYMLQSWLPLLNTEEERRHLLNESLKVVQKEEDRRRLLERFGTEHAQTKPGQSLLIRHHDERALRLQSVNVVHGFNPSEVESAMMRSCPVWELIESAAKQRSSAACWKAVKQQLQHYCTDESVCWPEVERLFHQSVFEAMALSAVDQQGFLLNGAELEPAQQPKQRVIPWDNPLLYAKQQLQTPQNKGPTFLTEDPGNAEQLSGNLCSQLDLSEMQNCRLRSLFDWYYTEHHDAAVFPQVLKVASEEFSCLDVLRGSHEDILYVFCHNPMNRQRQSKRFWDVALHTDVKFRQYVEHVADKISNWTKEEELKRKEKQIRTPSPAETPADENPGCSVVEEEALEAVIRKDSLKAWKLEQERLKKEETTEKSKKVPKGKQQKVEVQAEKKSKPLSGDKRSTASEGGGPAKTPTVPDVTTAPAEDEGRDLRLTEEPDNRFIGYAMNGQLIHASGRVQDIYPSDGGHITVESVSFVEGSNLMKVAVKKDGHHFHTHINQVVPDPPRPPNPPPDKIHMDPKEGWREPEAVSMKAIQQGSFSAVLSNQIHLSYSFYGPTGEGKVSFEKAKEEIPKASTQEPIPFSSSSSESKSRTQSSQGFKGQSAQPPHPFNGLSLSVPNGLLLQFLREETQGESPEESILVRQSFAPHGKRLERHFQDISLSKELHRIITSQGAVIRYMKDGSTEVLFADGAVSFSPDPGPVWVSDATADGGKKGPTSEKGAEAQRGFWQTTSPSGDRICTIGTKHKDPPSPSVCTFKATDPVTNQVMLTREDLVVIVQNPDGSLIVEHADGTRITSSPLGTPRDGPAPDCVNKSKDNGHINDARDKGEERSREDTLNGRILDQKDQIVFDRDAVREKGGELTGERVVLVEKEGYASVVMYPDRHAARVFLADGTIVAGNNQAEYEVFPSGAGCLHIQSDGACVYSSELEPKGRPSVNQPGVYTMSHTHRVACDVTDNDGNHFQVMEDGQVLVLTSSPTPGILRQKEEEADPLHVKHNNLFPRLFLVHEDGSGTELLNSHAVEEILHEAYSDPTIAVLKEPLPDTQDEFGITILKPSHPSVWSQWLLKKQNPDITPPNLRNRSWNDFPTADVQTKSPGLPPGTDMGGGLTLRERLGGPAAQQQRLRSCPKVLEMRQFYQHRPFTTTLRTTIDSRLKAYMESLMQRELQSEERKLKEPRSEEEIARSRDLFNRFLSLAEEEDVSSTADKRISVEKDSSPVDYASLYGQGVGASAEQPDVSEDTDTDADDGLDRPPLSAKGKDVRWTGRLEQLRQEIREEKACREALRKKIIVPYFHPENRPLYQSLLQGQAVNTRRRSQDLPPINKSDSARAAHESAPQPLSPTPSQSESRAAGGERMPERRHTNLTTHPDGESSLRSASRQDKSVQVDVTGKPNRMKLLTVGGPVSRRCGTASLADPSAVLRGFQLIPSSVDFGKQREGSHSTVTVLMRNLGFSPSRFSVKQPPPATGLRVIYNQRLVAAGLQVELQVQLFAMCDETESEKYVSQDIAVHTETDILYLPITANILWIVLCE